MAVIRKAGRAFVALFLAATALAATAPAAHAAPAPWRFYGTSTQQFTVGANATVALESACPAGFALVGAGFDSNAPQETFEVVNQYRVNATTYHVGLHNYTGSSFTGTVHKVCAWADHLPTITTVSATFPRNANGDAGGVVQCPINTAVLFGGADWNEPLHANNRIDLMSPTTNGTGWLVSGSSPANSTLHAEAYCAPYTSLGGAAVVTQTPTVTGGSFVATPTCPAHKRLLSGGLIAAGTNGVPDPTIYRATLDRSLPTGPTTWQLRGRVEPSTVLTATVICLAASQPYITKKVGPPALTNSTTAHFEYEIVEPIGENGAGDCQLDGLQNQCSGFSDNVGPLGSGPHTYRVHFVNVSGQHAEAIWNWTVDLDPPVGTVPDTTTLTGPLTMTFSEKVTGVGPASLLVKVQGQATAVAGTVALASNGLTATWTPAAPLVPGESYTVSSTSAIKDVAGNAITPVSDTVHAAKVVETTSPAVIEAWDPDSSAAASGGGYASSRNAGASATWKFTAASGQKATVFGVRQPNGGRAAVYVDGVKKATASFYAASKKHKVPVFTSAALSAGTHTVELRVIASKASASTGYWVGLDYLKFGASIQQETRARQRFAKVTAAPASQGSYETATHQLANDTGGAPSYSMLFRGTGVNLYFTRSPSSGSARIYVDDVLRKTVSLKAANTAFQHLVTVGGLADVRHRVRVVLVGTSAGSSSSVGLDRVDVLRTFN